MQIAILIVGILAPIFAAFGAAILTARWDTYAASRKAKAVRKAQHVHRKITRKGFKNQEKRNSISSQNEQRSSSVSGSSLNFIYKIIFKYIIIVNKVRLHILNIKYKRLNSQYRKHNAIKREDFRTRQGKHSRRRGLNRPPSVESSLSSISRHMRQTQKELYDSNTNIPK